MNGELLLIPAYAAFLSGAARATVGRHVERRPPADIPLWWLGGMLVLGVVIAERWMRVGYGPFATMYEVLISNLFSLSLVYLLAYVLYPKAREGVSGVAVVFGLMALWAGTTSTAPAYLPVTYENPWLWAHVAVGKVFLGMSLIAASLSVRAMNLARVAPDGREYHPAKAVEIAASSWQILKAAFIFHSLMLIAGAAWAQDAWGRFWAWDSLESSSFITWLVMAFALHARATGHRYAWLKWVPVLVFLLAFLTFFGLPFISEAPHKGKL